MIFKLIGFAFIWFLFMVLKASVALLGFLVVPVLYSYRLKPRDKVPRIFTPWLNPEDWNDGHMGTEVSLPAWWVKREGSSFKSWYHYHAIRNPANGLRNIEALDMDIVPDKVRYYTSEYRERYEPVSMRKDGVKSAWYVAYQGWQAGMKYVRVWNEGRHLVLKLGWRVEPKDRTVPIDPNGTRVHQAGFASKFLPYRRG